MHEKDVIIAMAVEWTQITPSLQPRNGQEGTCKLHCGTMCWLWECRNKSVHGKDDAEGIKMCKDKLRVEIQEIQKCPLEVGLEAANPVCEEGVDKRASII